MFRIRYMFSELRRRRGRTVLTALGLGLGVGLVVAVSALSAGLDEAQDEVLAPLTGVGTDLSVNRPINIETDEDGAPQISEAEQRRLRREGGPLGFDFDELGEAGEEFSVDNFISTDVSFPASKAKKINEDIDGVSEVSSTLTLNVITIEGTIPDTSQQNEGGFGGPGGGGPPGGGAGGPGGGFGFDPISVTGIQLTGSDLAPVDASLLSEGEMPDELDEALVSTSYAASEDIALGDNVKIAGKKLEVVGIVEAPVGAEASDIYMSLARLQKISDNEGRINGLEVRADSVDIVDQVAAAIESSFSGSEATTASELTSRVSGSLTDAKDLSGTLGTALSIVALLGAFGIAGLLTLSAVNKRTREIGTLKALGWRRSRVVSQITGESVIQGLLGGVAGAAIGVGAAGLIGALGITLEATAEAAQTGFGPPGGGPGGAGGGTEEAAAKLVELGAPVDPSLIVLAIGLAILGGLVAGSIGSVRAARMSPSEALRSVE